MKCTQAWPHLTAGWSVAVFRLQRRAVSHDQQPAEPKAYRALNCTAAPNQNPHPHSTPTATRAAKRGAPREGLAQERWFWTEPVLTAATQPWPGSPPQLFLLGAALCTKATPPSTADSGFKAYLLVRYGYLQTRLETHASLPMHPT